ncbi:MAG: NAD(P)H-hydrate dehydratase [Alphaproteobacteria bacterium]
MNDAGHDSAPVVAAQWCDGPELLAVAEMAKADALTIAAGTPGIDLMEAAGSAVAAAVNEAAPQGPIAVLCGPGNNGGDGFVAGRILAAAGRPVHLALAGDRQRLRGDAAVAASRWTGQVLPLDPACLDGATLVVDALFGAGLDRPLDGLPRAILESAAARRIPSVAVDVPSGVHGDSGSVLGYALPARETVTFFRRKPAHVLFPGRALCGRVRVADIGIPARVLESIRPRTFINRPDIWGGVFPWPGHASHKYTRGHLVIVGGGTMTGAARLAALAARRVGAGLVTVAAPRSAIAIYAVSMPGLLTSACDGAAELDTLLSDPRKNAILVGPGNGVSAETRSKALAALASGRPTVLDADALTVFEGAGDAFFAAIGGACLLTPHDGEFTRLFGALPGLADRLSRARAGARRSGATVLLKGADTVIARPDGRALVNVNAPPDLATGGSGDVLAGLCAGLIAQGMDPFEAAGAAAWLQGETARLTGPGLIAEDLCERLPRVLRRLKRILQSAGSAAT